MRLLIHLALHLAVPLIISRFWAERWKTAWLVMMSAMLIDVDHLFADPVFDPDRCSINFHPLHTHIAALLYVLLALLPVTRMFGVGLLIHIALDGIDCVWQHLE